VPTARTNDPPPSHAASHEASHAPGHAPTLDVWLDLVCPYAYFAHASLDALGARTGVLPRWRPFLLGGVFRALGAPDDPNPAMSAAKARHAERDLARFAEVLDLPLTRPVDHPRRTVLALRAALVSGDVPRAMKALFQAYWGLGLDVSSPRVVEDALTRAGFDGAALVSRAGTDEAREALRRETEAAVRDGVFGAPTFVVRYPDLEGGPGDEPTRGRAGRTELFWGQDRMVLVERELARAASRGREGAA
jgi:2-hydroxychromene-2-carboxylate isomerase